MELKVLNSKLELVGVMDAFNSLVWTNYASGGGSFELKLPFTSENILLIKRENIIYKEGEAGFIESVEIALDNEGIENITCSGKMLSNYLQRRIIWGYDNLNGNVETEMRRIVDKNFINAPKERKFPNLQLGTINNISGNVQKALSYDNVFDLLSEISSTNNVKFDIKLDYIAKKLNFIVYNNNDRTINQALLPRVVFSRDFENILEQNYIDSLSEFKNVTLVAGAGEGSARRRTTVGYSEGIERFELYTDAKDISDKKTISTPTGTVDENGNSNYKDTEVTMSEAEYIPLLKQRGNEKLAEATDIKTFDSVVNTKNESAIYKKDYFLGDKVTILDKKWGLTIDTQITEIQEIYEQSGYNINITFGNNIPTLLQKINKR